MLASTIPGTKGSWPSLGCPHNTDKVPPTDPTPIRSDYQLLQLGHKEVVAKARRKEKECRFVLSPCSTWWSAEPVETQT